MLQNKNNKQGNTAINMSSRRPMFNTCFVGNVREEKFDGRLLVNVMYTLAGIAMPKLAKLHVVM